MVIFVGSHDCLRNTGHNCLPKSVHSKGGAGCSVASLGPAAFAPAVDEKEKCREADEKNNVPPNIQNLVGPQGT